MPCRRRVSPVGDVSLRWLCLSSVGPEAWRICDATPCDTRVLLRYLLEVQLNL